MLYRMKPHERISCVELRFVRQRGNNPKSKSSFLPLAVVIKCLLPVTTLAAPKN